MPDNENNGIADSLYWGCEINVIDIVSIQKYPPYDSVPSSCKSTMLRMNFSVGYIGYWDQAPISIQIMRSKIGGFLMKSTAIIMESCTYYRPAVGPWGVTETLYPQFLLPSFFLIPSSWVGV